jgi:hypothetical protein
MQQSIPALFDCVSVYSLTRLTVWAKKGVHHGEETSHWQRMHYLPTLVPWMIVQRGIGKGGHHAAIWTDHSVKHKEEIKVMQASILGRRLKVSRNKDSYTHTRLVTS